MKMTDAEIVQGLSQQIMDSDSWSSGELSQNREMALKYYFGEKRGDEQEGCSQVISTDVADMLEAVIAGMMPALETERVIEFEAMSKDDEEQARQESDAVNWVIMSKNRGYGLLQQCIRDALLLRNGFTKTYIETERKTETNRYKDVEPAIFAMMQAAVPQGWQRELVSFENNDDGTVNFTLRDTLEKKELRVSSADPCNMYYTQGWTDICLDYIPFIAERILYTRSDLVKMGFSKSKVDDLKRITLDTDTDSDARNRGTTPDLTGWEPSQDTIECFECYWMVDLNDDGIAERRKFLLAGNTLLLNEEFPYIPYATGTGFLQPHRVTGMSLYDKLKEVQDIKTTTLRQYLDCFYNGNLGRMGYVKNMVNLDHLTNPQPSGVIELNSPDALVPIPGLDIGGSAQALLGYMDKVRSERGGASLDLQSAEAQVMGETAQGIERQYSVREMLAALMTRTLTETLIAGTYRNVHRAMRSFVSDQVTYRTKQGFENTNPADWQERDRINVRGGLSMGEQRKKTQALGGVIQQQTAMMTGGLNGVLVDLKGIYQASIDWARASGLDNPEAYFINPESPESQQTQQQQAQQSQMQQQLMIAMQQMQIQLAQQQQLLDRWKHETELQWKYFDSRLDAETKEAQMTADNVTRISVEAMKKAQGSDDYRKGE